MRGAASTLKSHERILVTRHTTKESTLDRRQQQFNQEQQQQHFLSRVLDLSSSLSFFFGAGGNSRFSDWLSFRGKKKLRFTAGG